MNSEQLVKRYRVENAKKFKLRDYDTADTAGLRIDKKKAKKALAKDIERLSELQERLYAEDRWSILLVFQAMDAAGKDSTIKHVMSGINPQGCQVSAFKAPSEEELDHNFLWRVARELPERGRIGIFNRSHYEEVLVVRVHGESLAKQKMPLKLLNGDIWRDRFKDIRSFEKHLARNGTVILKFFLHVSKEEQRQRFLARLEEPGKRWKFSMGDVEERKLWDRYMAAYEDMIRHTSTDEAPWHVIPADNKWFTQMVVAKTIVRVMQRLDLKYPAVDGDALKQMKLVRQALREEALPQR
jgi:PPK2 family polyphosphate:nucleotide phosphotransferase